MVRDKEKSSKKPKIIIIFNPNKESLKMSFTIIDINRCPPVYRVSSTETYISLNIPPEY